MSSWSHSLTLVLATVSVKGPLADAPPFLDCLLFCLKFSPVLLLPLPHTRPPQMSSFALVLLSLQAVSLGACNPVSLTTCIASLFHFYLYRKYCVFIPSLRSPLIINHSLLFPVIYALDALVHFVSGMCIYAAV